MSEPLRNGYVVRLKRFENATSITDYEFEQIKKLLRSEIAWWEKSKKHYSDQYNERYPKLRDLDSQLKAVLPSKVISLSIKEINTTIQCIRNNIGWLQASYGNSGSLGIDYAYIERLDSIIEKLENLLAGLSIGDRRTDK